MTCGPHLSECVAERSNKILVKFLSLLLRFLSGTATEILAPALEFLYSGRLVLRHLVYHLFVYAAFLRHVYKALG